MPQKIQQIKNRNLSRDIRKECKSYMDHCESESYDPQNEQENQNTLYERILEMVYGKEVWNHLHDLDKQRNVSNVS